MSMFNENIVKKKMANNEPFLVTGLSSPDSNLAELIAMSGVDMIMIDYEHCSFNDEQLLACCKSITSHGKVCALRTACKDEEIIKRYMQFGFNAICSTMCGGVEDAKKVVNAALFPPKGSRGLSNECRANGYGTYNGMSLEEYMKWRNDNMLIMTTLENKKAVDEAVEIFKQVPEIDMVHIGPIDLSASMGFNGETRIPEIREILSTTNRHLAELGNYNGYFAQSPDEIPDLLTRGAKCIFLPPDMKVIRTTYSGYANALKSALEK